MNWRRAIDAVRTGGVSLREADTRPRCPQCQQRLPERVGACPNCAEVERQTRIAAKPLTSAVLEITPMRRPSNGRTEVGRTG